MDAVIVHELAALLRCQPVAALGTLHRGGGGVEPFVSMVPVAWVLTADAGTAWPVIHVSQLAPHTRDLLDDPAVSLMWTAALGADDNPQALARFSLQAQAETLPADSADAAAARAAYLERFPRAMQTFALGDFMLVRLVPRSGRYVAGFGRAHALTGDALKVALRQAARPDTKSA